VSTKEGAGSSGTNGDNADGSMGSTLGHALPAAVEEDRRHLMEAAIVRIMKVCEAITLHLLLFVVLSCCVVEALYAHYMWHQQDVTSTALYCSAAFSRSADVVRVWFELLQYNERSQY
jgi:hypothetical protein